MTLLNVALKHDINPAANNMCQRVQINLNVAKQHLQQAQDRMTVQANKKRRDVTYQVGDEVMLSTKNIRLRAVGTPKLLPRYVGPFNVVKVISRTAVKLELPELWRVHDVFHVSLVKPYERSKRSQPLPTPLRFEEGSPVFEVEKILAQRTVKRGKRRLTEYLVKWKGFSQEPQHL
jgi:hypothetical protein